jgi:hypothetical protein
VTGIRRSTVENVRGQVEDRFDVVDGDDRWYSFSLKFDNGFSNPGGWCIPMQWHGADEDGVRRTGTCT